MEYFDLYKKRANRYGIDYQSRVQGEREKNFDLYLLKTLYRVDFLFENQVHAGSFEKYQQDEARVLHYLLTKLNLKMPNGTIIKIKNQEGIEENWMVLSLEQIEASGYNRYITLKMTHSFIGIDKNNNRNNYIAYLRGKEEGVLRDAQKSGGTNVIYNEMMTDNFIIMPFSEALKKDDYLIVGEKPFQQYFRVTGFDIQSNQGVEYITIDPIYEYDLSAPPEKQPEESNDDYFWFNGGFEK